MSKAGNLMGIMSLMGMMAKETTGYSYILDGEEELDKMLNDQMMKDAVETIEKEGKEREGDTGSQQDQNGTAHSR